MKYKIGDRVRIKEDLIHQHSYGGATVVSSMLEYLGVEAVIVSFAESYDAARLDICGDWLWPEDMLEDVKNSICITPASFYNTIMPEEQIQEPVSEVPKRKVFLTTGNENIDTILKYKSKCIRVEADLIECEADRVYEYAMNHWIPMAQHNIVVYGILSSIQEYSLTKKLYGGEYATERNTGKWVYLQFYEAYVENPNAYTEDLLNNFSTRQANARVDDKVLKRIRIPYHYVSSIEELREEDTPIARRALVQGHIYSKYDGDNGSCPYWDSP